MIVGYLVEGKFVCHGCAMEANMHADDPAPIRVSSENMGLYSQACSKCKAMTVHGRVETELFPTPEKSIDRTHEFRWTDMQQLLVKFDVALRDDDLEVVGQTRREMYERILKAIRAHQLYDAEMVLDAVGRIMETATRW